MSARLQLPVPCHWRLLWIALAATDLQAVDLRGPAPILRMVSDPVQAITPLDIAEDSDNNLWIAAEQGVFRFDGRHFDRIPGDFSKPMGIAILAKTVFVGAENGLFQYRSGQTTRVSSEATYGLVKASDDFLFLLRNFNGHKTDAGVWDGKRLHIYLQKQRLEFPRQAPGGAFWQVCGAHPCSIGYSDELRSAALKGNLASYVNGSAKKLMWAAGSARYTLFSPGTNGWYVNRDERSPSVSLIKEGMPERVFRVGVFTRANWGPLAYPDRNGRIWIPGDYLFVASAGDIRKFNARELEHRQVTCVFQDSRDRIWFGITGGGLAVMGRQPVIESWPTPSAYGEINALTRHGPDTLFAASYKGALFRKRGDAPWEELRSGGAAVPISQVAGGPTGPLYGLIRFGAPVRLSASGREQFQLKSPPETRLDALRRLVRAPDGAIFIGSQERSPSGLYRVSGNEIKAITIPGSPGTAGAVQDIVFDGLGNTLAAFEGGVCRVQSNGCQPLLSATDGLLSVKLRGIGISVPNEMWVAYRDVKAFSRFTYLYGKWQARHFTEKQGYSTPETMFLRRDGRGWVWRGTENGLFVSDGLRVEPEDWIQMTEQEGLPSRAISRYGFLEDADGSIWIGTASGIAHIHPSKSWFSHPGGARVSAVTFGREHYMEPVMFPSTFTSTGAFSVRLAGDFLLPTQYRLLPSDTAWHLNRNGEIQYGILDVGSYSLQTRSGAGSAVSLYSFDVTDPARTKTRAAIATGLAAFGLTALTILRRRRSRRDEIARRVLPDLTQLRMAALVPEARALIGIPLDARFVPHHLLARGGFATVFDGNDLELSRRCAIKVFHRDIVDSGASRRFQQEITALETLAHPNIVRIYGHGLTLTDLPYLVMEFIDGTTVRTALPPEGFPARRVASFLRQAGSALEQMHRKQIYHRDLKPDNLMIRRQSALGEDLVLIDFSIAIVKTPDQTMHGLSRAAGTIQYMAPEQAVGHAQPSTDIYSLAKVVIEMITGRQLSQLLPHASFDLSSRMREVTAHFPFTLSDSSIDLLGAALEFDPARRPTSALLFAHQIAADIEAALHDGDG